MNGDYKCEKLNTIFLDLVNQIFFFIFDYLYNSYFIYIIRYIYSYLFSQKRFYQEMYDLRTQMQGFDLKKYPVESDSSHYHDKKDIRNY